MWQGDPRRSWRGHPGINPAPMPWRGSLHPTSFPPCFQQCCKNPNGQGCKLPAPAAHTANCGLAPRSWETSAHRCCHCSRPWLSPECGDRGQLPELVLELLLLEACRRAVIWA